MTELPADAYVQLASADDPYPLLQRLREADPVHRTPLGFWFVTRHDDVKRLFSDPNVTGDRRAWALHQPADEGSFFHWAEEHNLFSLPPEEHARVRRLVSAALTPRAVRRMEQQIRDVVDRFAQPLRDRRGEVIDLYGDFTNLIPNTVISHVTGVSAEGGDEVRFRQLAQAVIAGFLPFNTPEVMKAGEAAFEELYGWVEKTAIARRAHPAEDMISDLVQVMDQDDRLDDREVIMLVTGLVSAGSETTAVGGMVLALSLLRHPDVLERLRGDRSLIPKAVNEMIRLDFGGPAGVPRYALRDFELRGKTIRKGDMLMLGFGGAGRDPAVYDDPDTFDMERDNRAMLNFGHGPHFCLGANLARSELGAMVDAMIDLLPAGSEALADRIEYVRMGPFRRPVNMPVRIPA